MECESKGSNVFPQHAKCIELGTPGIACVSSYNNGYIMYNSILELSIKYLVVNHQLVAEFFNYFGHKTKSAQF